MKKVKRFLMTLLPSFFVVGMCLPVLLNSNKNQIEDPGKDTAIYDRTLTHAQFNRPDIMSADDDEDEEETVKVDKVVLHYYNEAGGCDGRAFYLWVTGVDGAEYNFDNASDIMSLSSDNTMMTITIDFTDARFAAFAHKSSLFFIIKFKKISDTNLNWGGQSDDVQLRYADFPQSVNMDGDKSVCEMWTMPAAGGGIALLDSEAKTKVHGVKLAKFEDWKTISCKLTADTKGVKWKLYAYDETYFKIKPKKRADSQKWYLVKEGTGTGDFDIKLPYEAHINMVYSLVSHDPDSDVDEDMKNLDKTVTVSFENLYNSAKFHTYYETGVETALNQTGVNQLGMTYTPQGTTFKVWSPVSSNITVLIYDKDTSAEFAPIGTSEADLKQYDKYKGYHMHYTSGGVWELTIDGDLKGKYYNYQVDNTLGTNVCMDPYATSAGCNGLRGYIYDKADSNPTGWDALPVKWDGVTNLDLATPQDLTIYEVHIQDFTGDTSWVSSQNPATKRGTYKAFVESGTRLEGHPDITTGYDHLNGLGVGAVQLVPVFDHDNDESGETLKYNWGYNPLNYNVVEGGYSSNPHDGLARVKEFKEMVLKMSQTEAHTRVIMDVVYNHVSSATGSCFHKLMPRYYFRYDEAGELYDGSGCHNEVASDRPMMRKFIVDSLKMWATEYKIKGFRFDLMGLIDFQTLNKAREELYKIDPDIYLYGEGWTSGGYHGPSDGNWGAETWQIYNECNQFKGNPQSTYLGGFNDCFRNAVRGENSMWGQEITYPQAGFVQTGNWKQDGSGNWYCDYDRLDKISDGMWGVNRNVNTNGQITGYYPEQTVNYVSCHDNWTVRDQLFNTMPKSAENRPASIESILRGSLQAHALVMAGNSAAFILGGEELLRTKEYKGINPEDYAGVTKDSYTEMWGHNISHNSYNAPLSVNTFKWGNKVEVIGHDANDKITNEVFHYNEKFAELIKSHKGLLKKRGENNGYGAFVGSTSAGAGVMNRYWSEAGNFGNAVAFQANEAFVYTCAGNVGANDYIQCDCEKMNAWTLKFEYGISPTGNVYDNAVHFGGVANNAVLYYDRHGTNNQEGNMMKKNKLFLLSLLLIPALAGCNGYTYMPKAPYPGDPFDQNNGADPELPDIDAEFNMTVYFYLDYSHSELPSSDKTDEEYVQTNANEPVYVMKWYMLKPLGECPAKAILTSANAADPLYTKFLGYSEYPSSIDGSKLWDFKQDYKQFNILNLYGIWVSNEQEVRR